MSPLDQAIDDVMAQGNLDDYYEEQKKDMHLDPPTPIEAPTIEKEGYDAMQPAPVPEEVTPPISNIDETVVAAEEHAKQALQDEVTQLEQETLDAEVGKNDNNDKVE